MNCGDVQRCIELYVFGELETEAEEQVEAHVHQCADCQRLVDEQRLFLRMMDEAQAEPSAELLATCRSGLRNRLAAEGIVKQSFSGRLRELLGGWPKLLRPALGLAMLALSFYAGKMFEERKSVESASLGTARFTTVQGMGNGMVEIVLEEPRQRTILGGLHDAGIEQALMAAVRQASDPDMRVESVDLLRNRCNKDEVRRAVLVSLEKDDSPMVRMRALEALRPYAGESEVRQALSRVLLKDNNPNVRVQAIDLLMDRGSSEIVGTLQEVIRRDENDYIRSRCLRALSQLRASPGVF